MSCLVVGIYAIMMTIAYLDNWNLYYLILDFILYTASSIMFLWALLRIRRTMWKLDVNFSNEAFLKVHAINFIVYITVSFVTFGLSCAYAIQLHQEQTDQEVLERLRIQKSSLIFNNLQLPF